MTFFGAFRIKNNLYNPISIPEVDENQTTVVTPTVHPATKGYNLSIIIPVKFPATVTL
jgi:hypothetical protein